MALSGLWEIPREAVILFRPQGAAEWSK